MLSAIGNEFKLLIKINFLKVNVFGVVTVAFCDIYAIQKTSSLIYKQE